MPADPLEPAVTVVAPEPAAAEPGQRAPSPGRLALRRYRQDKAAVAAAIVFALIALSAILAPLLAPGGQVAIDLNAIGHGPSAGHLLGTDKLGRDVLARVLYGGQVSLLVGVCAALIAVVTGVLVGGLAAASPGWLDMMLMRIADVVLSLPSLIVILVLISILGPSVVTLIVTIGLFEWPVAARLVRSSALSTLEEDYIDAARGAGAGRWWLLRHHLIPAAVPSILVVATLDVAGAVLLEAGLSFLGLGVQPPSASWGNMLTAAQSITVVQSMPWLWIPPGVAIIVTVLSASYIGTGIQHAVDPRSSVISR